MAKWAVGLRLKNPDIRKVEAALEKGEILRTHVLRPTWHLVVTHHPRDHFVLPARRVRLAYDSYWKNHGISEELHVKSLEVIVRALEGKRYLTRQEIGEQLNRAGVIVGDDLVKYFLGRAEVDGIICNGVDKGNKRTYALLDERVLPMKELHK